MSKKLTFTEIKKEVKSYEEKKKVELSDGYEITIYPNFSPTKVSEYIQETVTDQLKAEELGINFSEIDTVKWSLFNLICKFTDLSIPSEIDKKVKVFLTFVESKYFPEIIASFPAESIEKLNIAASNVQKNLEQLNANQIANDTDTLQQKENLQ